MSIYTTPLQFGYILALLMAILFWIRGMREERLSDKLLGCVMFLLGMEIQDYTFGFAGINVLWNELNGFPRGTALLFGPALYFYLRSQINRDFSLQRKHLWHLVPWLIPFILELTIFLQGTEAVQNWLESRTREWLIWPQQIILWASYVFYFYKSLKLYQSYRNWAMHQYSNQDIISFKWFRNLLYFMIAGILTKEIFGIVDRSLNLDFYQDWWWNLAMVGIIFYVGIWGFAQYQPTELGYGRSLEEDTSGSQEAQKESAVDAAWKLKITNLMTEEKPFLDPQLSLKSLAYKLKTNPSILSAAINQNFDKNFNDFINEHRVGEYLDILQDPTKEHYTLLAMAYECGFNSKSTFNRAIKKVTGKTPKELKQNT